VIDYGEGELCCPVCGRAAGYTRERLERVVHAGRDHGWSQRLTVYVHGDGTEHRVPTGLVFDACA